MPHLGVEPRRLRLRSKRSGWTISPNGANSSWFDSNEHSTVSRTISSANWDTGGFNILMSTCHRSMTYSRYEVIMYRSALIIYSLFTRATGVMIDNLKLSDIKMHGYEDSNSDEDFWRVPSYH